MPDYLFRRLRKYTLSMFKYCVLRSDTISINIHSYQNILATKCHIGNAFNFLWEVYSAIRMKKSDDGELRGL